MAEPAPNRRPLDLSATDDDRPDRLAGTGARPTLVPPRFGSGAATPTPPATPPGTAPSTMIRPALRSLPGSPAGTPPAIPAGSAVERLAARNAARAAGLAATHPGQATPTRPSLTPPVTPGRSATLPPAPPAARPTAFTPAAPAVRPGAPALPLTPTAPLNFAAPTAVDESGYARLAVDVKALLGMDLTQYKPAQVWRRVNSFASAHGYKGSDDLLAAARTDRALRDDFRDMLTINVSEFFRNPEVWDRLAAQYLGSIMKAGRQARIWSAGCSIGYEPYTLGMLAREGFPQAGYRTVATDLDTVALAAAQAGRYREEQMLGISAVRRARFFSQVADGRWEVQPDLKSPITFRRHDLLADSYETGLDLIVCRNVVIYFTEDAKRDIFARFAASLRPGGILLIGSTESINQPRSAGLNALGAGFYAKAGA
jgi:chemotaxis protein methyltransferase CheR